jgi:hypothetical protein
MRENKQAGNVHTHTHAGKNIANKDGAIESNVGPQKQNKNVSAPPLFLRMDSILRPPLRPGL